MNPGVTSPEVTEASVVDEVLGNRAGSTVRQRVVNLAAQLSADLGIAGQRAAADQAAGQALAAALEAALARDIAVLNVGLFPSAAAGVDPVDGVGAGAQFYVIEGDEYVRYLNDDGVAVEVPNARLPTAALSRRGGDISAISNAVEPRAADVLGRYTNVLAGGDVSNRPQATYATADLTFGNTIVIPGDGTSILALRNLVPLVDGQTLELVARGGSAAGFPAEGSYELAIAWYDNTRNPLPGGDAVTPLRQIPDVSGFSTVVDRFTFGRQAPFAQIQAPAGAYYAQPFTRTVLTGGQYLGSYLWVRDADMQVGLEALRDWALSRDTPPTDLRLSATEVDKEAAVGSVVALLSVADLDPPGSPFYTLLDSAGGLFSIQRDRVIVNASLSAHEGEHTIRVRATDWFGRQIERSRVLRVVDNLFTPADLAEALFVLDTEFFTDVAGTVPASVNDRVRYIGDNAGGSNFFTTTSSLREPWLRADENGRLYLENPGDGGLQQRLVSNAPILPDSKEWYFGIVCAADDDRYVPLFAQRSFTSYDAPGNFQIQLNSNWGTSGSTGVVFLDRVLAYIQGATDGLQLPNTGPGIGQPRNGFLERGKPVLVEVIAREGHLASEVRFNGLLHDRFTMNVNTAQEVCWILNNQGAASGGNCRLYKAAALGAVPNFDILWKTRRWLINRGGVDLGYGVGQLPRIWSPRAIALAPDGTELAAVEPDTLASPASIAKAMSAMTAFRLLGMLAPDEDTALDTLFEVTEGDANITPGSSTAQLQGGDLVSLRDLLYGMALPSGNDAARCMARVFGGMLKELDGEAEYTVAEARARFVAEMNALSEDIGLVGATWTSPVGGADARVSARHCAQMFQILIRDYPTAADIFSTLNRTITITGENARTYAITSTNKLLERGETWTNACKTGTLSVSGACAVLSWETATGETIVQVNMGALNNSLRWGDQQVIRDVVLRDWQFVDGEPVQTR